MVEGGGFEPPKSLTTDLQSVPFGRSGIPPDDEAVVSMWSWRWDSNPQPADYKSAALPIELRQHSMLCILAPHIDTRYARVVSIVDLAVGVKNYFQTGHRHFPVWP